MAEIRKFNPSLGEGIGKLVREAVGGDVRPFEPGQRAEADKRPDEADAPPASTSSVPGVTTSFTAGTMSFLTSQPTERVTQDCEDDNQ